MKDIVEEGKEIGWEGNCEGCGGGEEGGRVIVKQQTSHRQVILRCHLI